MQIIDNKAILLETVYPERITTIIPKSKLIKWDGDKAQVLIHWGLDECKVLQNLGFNTVPAPINLDYEWSGMYKPYEHQKHIAGFLAMNRRAYNLADMGVGKTASTAWAADYLMEKGLVTRMLIICPLSIMRTAWQADLFKVVMHRSVGIAHGSVKQRKEVIASDVEIVIINFDGVEMVLSELIAGNFDLIAIDEATALKNVSTRRWKAINQLVKPNTYLWLMTGTPAAQSPVDAYGLIKLMHPDRVDRSESLFKDRVMRKVSNFTWVARPEANGYIHSLMQPAIRYTKDECLDLPELTYIDREVQLTKQQEVYYKRLKDEMLFELNSESVTAVNAAVKMNKLLQVAAGSVLTDSGEVVDFDCSTRLTELISLIENSSHSVLVFCAYRSSISRVSKSLTEKGHTVDVIHGDVSLTKRTEVFQRFQSSGQKQVLVIQPQSASHGVTLHAANTVVWWSPTTSYETYAQANARVHRNGQVNRCTVVHLQGCSVEKKLYSALKDRNIQQENLLGLYKELLAGE